MIDYVYSDRFPRCVALRDRVRIPYGVEAVQATGEDGEKTQYRYEIIEAPIVPGLAIIDQARAVILAKIRADASRAITDAGYPWWVQVNVALGIYPADVGQAVRDYIAAVIVESNRCEDAAALAMTEEQLVSIRPAWPGNA